MREVIVEAHQHDDASTLDEMKAYGASVMASMLAVLFFVVLIALP